MKVRPVKTEADYRAALAEIERLFDARTGTTASDRLEILTTLVEAYEEAHDPIPAPDPVEAIRYAMESKGLSGDDLVPYLGSRQRVKEVLTHKRPLTLNMIRRLHEGLGVSADILIRPLRMKAAA